MKKVKTLHLASFDGNIGDSANHYGFYKYLQQNNNFIFEIDKLEIREFYWNHKKFDEEFVELVNKYDFLIIGGANFFELWVEDSPTGTSIAIELNLLEKISIPILFNAVGIDSGQGVSEKNKKKFKKFLDLLIKRDDFISMRNDGSKETIIKNIDIKYLNNIYHTVDAGFFIDVDNPTNYYLNKKYIAINIASDMPDVRFKNISYKEVISSFKDFIHLFLKEHNNFEIVFIPHIYRDITFINDIILTLDDSIRRRKVSIAPLLHGEDSFKEVMPIYKNAQLVLANRFHANVCSIGLEVPTIGLVNYRQIEKLYNELDSDNYVYINKKGFEKELLNKISSNISVYNLSQIKQKYQLFHNNISRWINNHKKFRNLK